MPYMQESNPMAPYWDAERQTYSHPLFADANNNREEDQEDNDQWPGAWGYPFGGPPTSRGRPGQPYQRGPVSAEHEPYRQSETEKGQEYEQPSAPRRQPYPFPGHSRPHQRPHGGPGGPRQGGWGGFRAMNGFGPIGGFGPMGGFGPSDSFGAGGFGPTPGVFTPDGSFRPMYGSGPAGGFGSMPGGFGRTAPGGFGGPTPGVFTPGGSFRPMCRPRGPGGFERPTPGGFERPTPGGFGPTPNACGPTPGVFTAEGGFRPVRGSGPTAGFAPPNAFRWEDSATEERRGDFQPDVDVFDTPDTFVVYVSLSGGKKEDMGVNWDPKKFELSISGTINRPGDEEFLKKLALDERRVGKFERKVRLGSSVEPVQIDVDAITAKMDDGILTINVPKLESDFVDVKKVDIE